MLGITINGVHVDVLENFLHSVGSNCGSPTKSLAQLREDWCTRQGFETLNFDVALSVVCLEEDVADNNDHNCYQHVHGSESQTGEDTEHVANNGNVTEDLNWQ
jgi:hypothetical protein